MSPRYPDRRQQIIHAHAPLVVAVARACRGLPVAGDLGVALDALERDQQKPLADALRRILDGQRMLSVLAARIADDDRVVVEAVLTGITNPDSLPDPQLEADPGAAAPGLASMVHAAAKGDAQALSAVSAMAEQMLAAGGDMARLGGIMRRLINGERDADPLSQGMSAHGRSLVLALLEELGKLEAH